MAERIKRSFEEVQKRSTRKQSECVVCGDPYPEGEFRGRIQLVLYKHRPLSGNVGYKDGAKPKLQEQKTVANETRIMCESCSVELFEQLAGELPERQKARADKP